METRLIDTKPTGSLEVICGSMFSGKTEELIRRLKRCVFAGLQIAVFKPSMDTRYDSDKIVSHDKNCLEAVAVKFSKEILQKMGEATVIGIDEAQFFDANLPEICLLLANSGKRVIVAGLDRDYLGKPFGTLPTLLALADDVTKTRAICMECGALASFSFRKTNSSALVDLGEKDKYLALCRKHYLAQQP